MNVRFSLTLALVMAAVLILEGTSSVRVITDGKARDAIKVGQMSSKTG